jgi:hypothetical protein
MKRDVSFVIIIQLRQKNVYHFSVRMFAVTHPLSGPFGNFTKRGIFLVNKTKTNKHHNTQSQIYLVYFFVHFFIQ